MEENKIPLGAMIEYKEENYLIIGYENEREELKGYKCIKRFERVKEDEIFTLSNE